mgnify:CR=1 FL=1
METFKNNFGNEELVLSLSIAWKQWNICWAKTVYQAKNSRFTWRNVLYKLELLLPEGFGAGINVKPWEGEKVARGETHGNLTVTYIAQGRDFDWTSCPQGGRVVMSDNEESENNLLYELFF